MRYLVLFALFACSEAAAPEAPKDTDAAKKAAPATPAPAAPAPVESAPAAK
jgi:hypothetical protein